MVIRRLDGLKSERESFIGSLELTPHRLYIERNSEQPFTVQARIGNGSRSSIDELSECFVSLTLDGTANANTISISPTKFNLALNGTQTKIQVRTKDRSARTIVTAHTIDQISLKQDRMSILVYYSSSLHTLTDLIGWSYFFVWSISFYPQIWLNFKRKSVIGLHFDFLVLNILGFFCMSVFNVGLYFIPSVQAIYFNKSPNETELPLALNDVVFSLHALTACLITGLQCLMYKSEQQQKISSIGYFTIAILSIPPIVSVFVASISKNLDILNVLYVFSYVKLAVTTIKYIPQAYFNYKRKSTFGWSIGNILLDISGSLLSLLQQILMAINFDSLDIVFGNPVKFGLAMISMAFDCLFIVQHYCLYAAAYRNYRIPITTETVSADGNEDSSHVTTSSII